MIPEKPNNNVQTETADCELPSQNRTEFSHPRLPVSSCLFGLFFISLATVLGGILYSLQLIQTLETIDKPLAKPAISTPDILQEPPLK